MFRRESIIKPPLQVRVALSGSEAISTSTAVGRNVVVTRWDPSALQLRRVNKTRNSATVRQRVQKQKYSDRAASGNGSHNEHVVNVVYALDDAGKIEDHVVSHVQLPQSNAEGDPVDNVPSMQWSAGNREVTFQWVQRRPMTWTVLRDGDVIATLPVGTTEFTDTTGDRGKNYSYLIEGEAVKSTEADDSDDLPSVATYGADVPASSSEAIGETYSDSLLEKLSSRRDFAPDASRPSPLPGGSRCFPKVESFCDDYGAELMWSTFIEESLVDAPLICPNVFLNDIEYFKGDNRLFSVEPDWPKISQSSRTAVRIQDKRPVDATSSIDVVDKSIGTTVAYDGNFKEVQRATASADGIRITNFATNILGTRVEHHVGDPLCGPLVGPISKVDYDVIFHLNSDGWMDLYGTHDLAPNHEALVQFQLGNKFYRSCWYRFRNRGLPFLASPLKADVVLAYNPVLSGAKTSCPIS